MNKFLKYKDKYRLLQFQSGGNMDLSGPISFHIYKLKDTVFYMFGDHHGGYENVCYNNIYKCGLQKDCYNIHTLISMIIDKNMENNYMNKTNNMLDVYLEMGYERYRDTLVRIQDEQSDLFEQYLSLTGREKGPDVCGYGPLDTVVLQYIKCH